MKVCYLNHDLRDDTGAGRFGRALIGHLRLSDPSIEPVVLTSIGSSHPWETPLLAPGRYRLIRSLPRIRRVFRSCDLIHALDGWPYGALSALAAIGLSKPLIITAIGTGAIQPLCRRWQASPLRWAYRRADRLIAVSNYTRREILKKAPRLGVGVINHAIEADEFATDAPGTLSPAERSEVLAWRPYVLSVGAPKPRKGFSDSLRAFSLLKRQFPGLRYVVVGGGSNAIRAFARELGLERDVVFLSGISRERLIAFYQSAELFMLLPVDDHKDVEGFGFAFLEAAAAGIPVIGTLESGAEDAVAEGENGFLVPPRDSEAAARAAIRILGDPALRARLAAGSRAFAGRMNWEGVAARYAEMYRELVGR